MLTTRRGVTHLALEISSDWFIVMRITSRQSCRRSNKFLRLVMNRTDELRTARIESLVTPAELAQQLPVGSTVAENVTASRKRIERILSGDDKRLLVIVGPCSIHDTDAAVDYAQRLATMRDKYQNRLEIVMRTYFEKPRTVIGWKGLIFDPDLNGSYRVNHGIRLARWWMPTAT